MIVLLTHGLFVDPCAEKPCENNGECDDNSDSYSCRCESDFTGTNCETKLDDCDCVICGNNGTCVDGIETYTCRSQCGFMGRNCETRVNNGNNIK